MKLLNLGCGDRLLDGFDNLDAETGWRFEDGLGDYADGSVAGLSISHSLMFVALADWPEVFGELARVLEPGGVLRITEDATDDPRSERFGGHPDAVTLTSPVLVIEHMKAARLNAMRAPVNSSYFRDTSLIQQHHGPPPKTFHVEGVKP